MTVLRAILRLLLGEYEIYRVLQILPGSLQECASARRHVIRRLNNPDELSACLDPELSALSRYAADEAVCFVAQGQHGIVAACWFWYGKTYSRRNFWPLQEREAKLVQINTSAQHRNRGIAQDLIRYGCEQMFLAGFHRLYARVWHSDSASLTAFKKVGWEEVAIVVTMQTLGRCLRISKARSSGIRLQIQR